MIPMLFQVHFPSGKFDTPAPALGCGCIWAPQAALEVSADGLEGGV